MTLKKDEIIEYALRLIKQKSFSSFSYEDISKELKMTKAAVHYHFEKKEDLGVAVCARLQEGLKRSYDNCLIEIEQHKGHPWSFIESRVNTIAPDEICPILSLQSDYENMSDKLKEMIKKLCMAEIDLLEQLVKKYANATKSNEVAVSTLMSIKGVLQYRRILGEENFTNVIINIKNQFYASIEE